MIFASSLYFATTLILPVALLAGVFIYARVQRDEPIDLVSGASAYIGLMLAASALLLATGLGRFLAGVFADLDASFTYEALSPGGGFIGEGERAARQDADLSGGLGLLLAGVALATFHLWLRYRFREAGSFDGGVERALEVIMTIVFGLAFVVLAANAASGLVERIYSGEDAAAPGESLAFAIAFALPWLIYGARVLGDLQLFPAQAEGGPGEEGGA